MRKATCPVRTISEEIPIAHDIGKKWPHQLRTKKHPSEDELKCLNL